MKIAVVGTGYVGLVTGTCLAETGNQVCCVDIDVKKVENMKNGVIPIFEPGLEILFKRNISQNRLKFTTNLEEAVKDAEIVFLALPTPPGGDGSADLSYILGVAKDLGPLMTSYKIIVDKSTVPVGTAELVHKAIAETAKGDFDVVSNPEFLREGVAVEDFMKPDRVVIGTTSEKAKKALRQLFAPYVRQGNPIIFMDERSAELTKYAANSFLAAKISFMNEISILCEKMGANVNDVRNGIGSDARIGRQFLYAGVGYGGSCFPKDVQALAKTSNEFDYNFKILNAVMDVNVHQRQHFMNKIKSRFSSLKGKKFAMWGLAFKPNTDDIREAPALYIIDMLLAEGAQVSAFDPEAMKNVQGEIGDKIQYGENEYDVLKDADALLILTEWTIFRTPDFSKIKSLLKSPIIFDGRNLYNQETIEESGFYYDSMGRAKINPEN
jgi:UDPglucose 6-dehydrogenase